MQRSSNARVEKENGERYPWNKSLDLKARSLTGREGGKEPRNAEEEVGRKKNDKSI